MSMPRHRLGLVVTRGRVVWGYNHGLMLPEWLSHPLCGAWNWAACRVLGHDDLQWHMDLAGDLHRGAPCCIYCCATLTGCVGHKGEG